MQLWPPVVEPRTLTRQVWDMPTARSLPGVARALKVYSGQIGSVALDHFRGDEKLPRTPFLELPDPLLRSLATFSMCHVEDYLLDGNALHLVTARDADQWPAAVRYFPASMWSVSDPSIDRRLDRVTYFLNGIEVRNREDVVHVQRGAHWSQPWRGVGVVEEHLHSLNRVGLQEEAERVNLTDGGVPSVALIAPQQHLTQDEIDEAGDQWAQKFAGPGRRPAMLPNGTTVVPLAWSPEDQQATMARQMSLIDVANIFNLDPWWLGSPGGSHNYKSPGPMFTALLRTALEPVMTVLEQVWSLSWLPRGRRVAFDRVAMTRDDFATTVTTLTAATGGKAIMTREEARVYVGWSPEPVLGEFPAAPEIPVPGATDPADDSGPGLSVVPGNGDNEDDDEEQAS